MQTIYLPETLVKFEDLRDLIREEVGKLIEEVRGTRASKPVTIAEVAYRYDVSEKTVYNWVKKKLIIGFKIGKTTYFNIEQIEERLINAKHLDALERKGLKEKREKIY